MSELEFIIWLNVGAFIFFAGVFTILVIRVKNERRKRENEKARMEHRQDNNDDT